MVELRGIEPRTSWMPFKRSPSWAIAPLDYFDNLFIYKFINEIEIFEKYENIFLIRKTLKVFNELFMYHIHLSKKKRAISPLLLSNYFYNSNLNPTIVYIPISVWSNLLYPPRCVNGGSSLVKFLIATETERFSIPGTV